MRRKRKKIIGSVSIFIENGGFVEIVFDRFVVVVGWVFVVWYFRYFYWMLGLLMVD